MKVKFTQRWAQPLSTQSARAQTRPATDLYQNPLPLDITSNEILVFCSLFL